MLKTWRRAGSGWLGTIRSIALRSKTEVPPIHSVDKRFAERPQGRCDSEHVDHEALDPRIRASVLESQRVLESLGATIVEVHLPHTAFQSRPIT